MKKTFTINISGNIFHIEEDAFEKLQGYLQRLKNHFGGEAEGREIVSDIEARIAELFLEKSKGENSVISIEWVDEVISVMGAPEDFMEEESADEPFKANTKKKRRLYRDPDSRIIAGVCSGLGAYFKVDPIVMRIIFLVLLFANGIGLLAYLILWIAVPKAATTTQRLEMRGEEINISNIEKSVKVDGNEGKEEAPASAMVGATAKTKVKRNQSGDAFGDFFRGLFKAFGVAIGIFLILIGFFGLIGFLSTLVIGQTFLSDWPLAWSPDVQFSGFFEHFVSRNTFSWGIILIAILTIIPMLAILYAGTKLVFRYKSNNTAIGLGMVGIWLVALMVLVGITAREAGNYKNTTSLSSSETLYPKENTTLHISMAPDKYADYSETDWNIDRMKIIQVEGRTIFLGKPRFDIEKSISDECVLLVKKRSRGKTSAIANENIQNIVYQYQVTDSTLILDPWFLLGESDLWRDQQVELILKLPEGKSVYLEENMEEIIHDIENVSNTWDREMIGKNWIMMPGGLTMLDSLKVSPKEFETKEN